MADIEHGALPVDFSSLTEPLPPELLQAASKSDDPFVRWRFIEYRFAVPNDVFMRLVDDPVESVRSAAIRFAAATAEQIDAGVTKRPELSGAAIGHPHASRELMDSRPVGCSDGSDRQRYLDMVGANPEERNRFIEMAEATEPDTDLTVTLGDIWAASRRN